MDLLESNAAENLQMRVIRTYGVNPKEQSVRLMMAQLFHPFGQRDSIKKDPLLAPLYPLLNAYQLDEKFLGDAQKQYDRDSAVLNMGIAPCYQPLRFFVKDMLLAELFSKNDSRKKYFEQYDDPRIISALRNFSIEELDHLKTIFKIRNFTDFLPFLSLQMQKAFSLNGADGMEDYCMMLVTSSITRLSQQGILNALFLYTIGVHPGYVSSDVLNSLDSGLLKKMVFAVGKNSNFIKEILKIEIEKKYLIQGIRTLFQNYNVEKNGIISLSSKNPLFCILKHCFIDGYFRKTGTGGFEFEGTEYQKLITTHFPFLVHCSVDVIEAIFQLEFKDFAMVCNTLQSQILSRKGTYNMITFSSLKMMFPVLFKN